MKFEKENLGTEQSTALDEILFAHAEDDAEIQDFTPGTIPHKLITESELVSSDMSRDAEIEGLYEYRNSDDNRTVGVSLDSFEIAEEEPAETVYDIEARFVGFDDALKMRGVTE